MVMSSYDAQIYLQEWRQFHIEIFENLCSYNAVDIIIKHNKPENCYLLLQRMLCIDSTFIKDYKMSIETIKNGLYFKCILNEFVIHYQFRNRKLGLNYLQDCLFFDVKNSIPNELYCFNIPIQYLIFF